MPYTQLKDLSPVTNWLKNRLVVDPLAHAFKHMSFQIGGDNVVVDKPGKVAQFLLDNNLVYETVQRIRTNSVYVNDGTMSTEEFTKTVYVTHLPKERQSVCERVFLAVNGNGDIEAIATTPAELVAELKELGMLCWEIQEGFDDGESLTLPRYFPNDEIPSYLEKYGQGDDSEPVGPYNHQELWEHTLGAKAKVPELWVFLQLHHKFLHEDFEETLPEERREKIMESMYALWKSLVNRHDKQ